VNDLDIGIDADPVKLSPGLAEAFGGSFFALDETRRLVRVMLPEAGVHLDLQPLRGSIEEDLRTRDFTVERRAADVWQAGVVGAVSEPNLVEDPLRLLRGVRLATVLGFEIEPETTEMIRRNAEHITEAAADRQREELMLILGTGRAGAGLRILDDLGLLSRLLPELDVTRGVDQPKEHHWDVLNP